MCGIAGSLAFGGGNTVDKLALETVSKAMEMRGPDGHSSWFESDQTVALAHRRLAIIDLSERGVQPMLDSNQRYVISFNGEIYNYRELRQQCIQQGYQFQSDSDTEVLLALYEQHGETLVTHLRGMFAFAIYDRVKKTLLLARDHLGIKPLYYTSDKHQFSFASSLQAMLAGGWIDSNNIDLLAKATYLNLGSVAEPRSCYQQARMLPAGNYALISAANTVEVVAYWHMESAAQSSTKKQDDKRIIEQAIEQSVACHLESDVPVGIFLSAGIDSSVVATMMKRNTTQKITAITLGFEEFSELDDEVKLARQFAEKHQLDHHVYLLSKEEFLAELPKFYTAMEQPTIDALNVWFVAKAAKSLGLKVVLSGLGGDELFGGYPSFDRIPILLRWSRLIRCLPLKLLAKLMPKINASKLGFLPNYCRSAPKLYHLQRSIFMLEELESQLQSVGYSKVEASQAFNMSCEFYAKELYRAKQSCSTKQRISMLETKFYMRNQLLRDADWAGMAHSVEIRTPLVDSQLFETIYACDEAVRFSPNKAALLDLLDEEDKQRLENRPKTGFILPMQQWLNGSEAEAHWSRYYAKMVDKRFFVQ